MPVATAEEQPKKEYKEFDMSIIRSGGGDFADYVQLPAEEAFEAYISNIKSGTKLNKESGEEEPRVYVWAKLTKGDAEGQEYRNDFSPSLDKKSNLQKFLTAVYGEYQKYIEASDLLGRPVRIELSEPWGEKGLQFIKVFKKPTASQKRVDVAPAEPKDPGRANTTVGDVVPTQTMSAEEFDAVLDAAGADESE